MKREKIWRKKLIETLEIRVDSDLESLRLDKAILKIYPNFTRSRIQNLIENNFVFVNDLFKSKNYKVKPDDRIRIILEKKKDQENKPENIPLDIVYEDKNLLVVNKPKGMVVHPAPGHSKNTLVNALLYHCKGSLSGINGVIRPGIVHRIDKDTSGLLIVAKDDYSHQSLAKQIKDHSFSREYESVVYGNLKEDEGRIIAPIGRNNIDRKKMAVTEKNSKEAITNYKVIKRYSKFTHIRLRLETGRTHQIRVHMAYIGHPVAGDPVYGPKKVIEKLKGQCLHAKMIGFIHPVKNKYLEFESDLPCYFKDFLRNLN